MERDAPNERYWLEGGTSSDMGDLERREREGGISAREPCVYGTWLIGDRKWRCEYPGITVGFRILSYNSGSSLSRGRFSKHAVVRVVWTLVGVLLTLLSIESIGFVFHKDIKLTVVLFICCIGKPCSD